MRVVLRAGGMGILRSLGERAEAEGVGKDTTTNHEAVEVGVLLMELDGMGVIFDVTVDDELGVGGDLVAEGNNIGDEFEVSGDFGHFFASAEVDGEGGEMLFEKEG